MEENINKRLIYLFVICAIVVCVIGAYYTVNLYKTKSEVIANDDRLMQPVLKELDINTSLIQGLYDRLATKAIQENNAYEYLSNYYETDKLVTDFNDEFVVFLALIQLWEQGKIGECEESITTLKASDVRGVVSNIFGNNFSYNDLSSTKNDMGLSFIYDEQSDVYNVKSGLCNNLNEGENFVETKLYKAAEDNDKIYLYEKVSYVSYEENDINGYVMKYHDDYKESNVIGSSNEMGILDNKISTYKYTYQKVDGKYYLYSVSKVDE